MYASDLEKAFFLLMAKSDAASTDPSDYRARMESLRGYGRLPRGRENHATLLSDEQIADAVLSLCTVKPKWAGHIALVLRSLKPVGGIAVSFGGAETLNRAVQILLSDKAAREQLIELTLTAAEHGTNANGHATLTYKNGDQVRTSYYVHQLALSLHSAGAEKTYNPSSWARPSSRRLVLNRSFFDMLADRAGAIRRLRPSPSSDGSEYDASEADGRRLQALGVRNGSRYLNIGVDNQVTWPRTEALVTFDRYTMVLLPKTKEHVQSISIDLTANKLSDEAALTVINRFLSLLCYCDDQFAVAQGGWSGNPVPVAVPRRDLAFTTTTQWVFDRKISASDEARRALALYREARNAEQNFLVSYAVLGYFKIIEILHPNEGQAALWIGNHFAAASAEIPPHILDRFNIERGTTSPEEHINRAYRIAVAHASPRKTQPSDPDCSIELRRLHTAAEVLRPLARHFMKYELAISDSPFSEAVT